MNRVDKTLFLTSEEYYADKYINKIFELLKKNKINQIIHRFEAKNKYYLKYTLANIFYEPFLLTENRHYVATLDSQPWHITPSIYTTSTTKYDKQAIFWFKLHNIYSQIIKPR